MRKIEQRIIEALKQGKPMRYKFAYSRWTWFPEPTGAYQRIYHDEVTRDNVNGTVYRLLGTELARLAPGGKLYIGISRNHIHATSRTTQSRINALCHGFGLRVSHGIRRFEKGEYTL